MVSGYLSGCVLFHRLRGPMLSTGIIKALLLLWRQPATAPFLFCGCLFSFPAQAVKYFQRNYEEAVVTGISIGLRVETLSLTLDPVSPPLLSFLYRGSQKTGPKHLPGRDLSTIHPPSINANKYSCHSKRSVRSRHITLVYSTRHAPRPAFILELVYCMPDQSQ